MADTPARKNPPASRVYNNSMRVAMDPKKKVINSTIMQRMEALEKGDLSNCSGGIVTFLVGPEHAGEEIVSPREMRACKFDLLMASEYFAGLLRSPYIPPEPIPLKHVEPAIFKLVIEYTHGCSQLVSKVGSLEQCLKLSAAADEFLLEDLGDLCTDLLAKFISSDNVWKIFNENLMTKFTIAACMRLLSAKTNVCLEMPAFLDICEEALIKFLQLEKMKIESEIVLVRACIKYVSGKDDERDVFRRAALPHLRLLLLNAEEFVEITPFLNIDEKVFLSLNLSHRDPLSVKPEISDRVLNLCKERERRHFWASTPVPRQNYSWDLLPKDKSILDIETMVGLGSMVKLGDATKFVFFFESSDFLRVTGLEILCPIDFDFFETDSLARLKSKRVFKWDDSAVVEVSISSDNYVETSAPLKPKQVVDSWACFETCILVPKGSDLKIEVTFNDPCYIMKVLADDTERPDDFEQYFRVVDDDESEFDAPTYSWEKSEGPTLSIFKSIHYEKAQE